MLEIIQAKSNGAIMPEKTLKVRRRFDFDIIGLKYHLEGMKP